MPLKKIEIRGFRCIDHVGLELDDRQNLIFGSNAAGKTSILEAIYTLGSGHSFRTTAAETLVQQGKTEFSIVGAVDDGYGVQSVLGLSVSRKSRELRLNGSKAGVSEFASVLPVQVIDPDVHDLVDEGPARRRRFIDWGSFHVEHGFKEVWRRFARAIAQRNAALKQRLPQFNVWNAEFLASGTQLTAHREAYLRSLQPFITNLSTQLIGAEVQCTYMPGWNRQLSFEEALSSAQDRDIQQGVSSVGPQRAELMIKLDGSAVKDRVSRGQQKLIACVLILAQQLHCAENGSRKGCLLLDDPAAELDVDNLGKLFEIISVLPVQLIVTALSPVGLTFLKNPKVFHVERGTLKPMA